MGKCPDSMTMAGFNTGGTATCSHGSGYSFFVISAVPTADQIPKICASSSCQRVMAAMKVAQPTECNTGGPAWDFMVYAQIFNPIAAACGQSLPAPVPAPASPPPAPVPVPPTTSTPTQAPIPPTVSVPTQAPPSSTTIAPVTTLTPIPPAIVSSTPTPTVTSVLTPVSTNGSFRFTPTATVQLTPSSTMTATTTASSHGFHSTMIIVAGVVVLIVVVAYLAFGAGKGNYASQSPREPSYVVQDDNKSTRDAPNRQQNYVISPIGTDTLSSATQSTARATRSVHKVAEPVADGLWTDKAIQKARIPLDKVLFDNVVSVGAFGEVLRGAYNGQTVAVKRLLPARRKDMKEIESFLEEAKLLIVFHHPCIVQFVGVAWDSLTDLCIVTEFMDGGDLRSLLQHADINHELTGFDTSKVKIALHIIHALVLAWSSAHCRAS